MPTLKMSATGSHRPEAVLRSAPANDCFAAIVAAVLCRFDSMDCDAPDKQADCKGIIARAGSQLQKDRAPRNRIHSRLQGLAAACEGSKPEVATVSCLSD